MKRCLRYASLILCLLLLAAWGWSVRYYVHGRYWDSSDRVWRCEIDQGVIEFSRATWGSNRNTWLLPGPEGLSFSSGQHASEWDQFILRRLGFVLFLPEKIAFGPPPLQQTVVRAPLWMISLPVLLITAWLWWPWIRERRMKRGAGFEVEAKPKAKSE